jgi:FkbM family methyltransferase
LQELKSCVLKVLQRNPLSLNPIAIFSRPEYFFRPSQVVRRLRRVGKPPGQIEDVKLPWGADIRVRIAENVGSDIYYYGVFDRIVPEAIWRLLDPGETAVDIGANIGQNTSAMACRVGPDGRVIAFEPHPATFAELNMNVEGWQKAGFGPFYLHNLALADKGGTASLDIPTYFSGASLSRTGEGIAVSVGRLDDFISADTRIHVCKIDVEGREWEVLKGAALALSKKMIRDIIFEDFNPMPSPAVEFLRAHEFAIYRLLTGWLKPSLERLSGDNSRKQFSYNYLATLAPERAMARFRSPGWRCLLNI